MVVGTARASLIAAKTFKFTFTVDTANADLRAQANVRGYTSQRNVEITINPGVNCYGSDVGHYGIYAGSWPAGTTVTLINYGYISGAGGAGGNGQRGAADFGPYQGYPASAGQQGGNAIYAMTISGFTFKLNNLGVIRSGGGGGGGGGSGGYTYGGLPGMNYSYVFAGGGGGGGGQGYVGGAGAAGGSGYVSIWGGNYYEGPPFSGDTGGNGSIYGAGGYSNGGTVPFEPTGGGGGGAGGAWGTAGSGGGNGYSYVPEYCCYCRPCQPVTNYAWGGAGGGPPGYSIVGFSRITYINLGSYIGPLIY